MTGLSGLCSELFSGGCGRPRPSDCAGLDLPGFEFCAFDLPGFDFAGLDFCGFDFPDFNFSGAVLRGFEFRVVDFFFVGMMGA